MSSNAPTWLSHGELPFRESACGSSHGHSRIEDDSAHPMNQVEAKRSCAPQPKAAMTAACEPFLFNFSAASKGVFPVEFLTFLSAPDSRSADTRPALFS